MTLLDDTISVLNRLMPEPMRIPDDRRQWWVLQICAHIALISVYAVLLICVSFWLPDTDIVVDRQFILESLGTLLPGLFLIQAYFVPVYFGYLRGRNSLWKFFAGTLLVVVVGPLFYPVFLYFLDELWAQIMLLFVMAASGLMFAEAVIMHFLVKWWLARNKPNDNLLPPFSGSL